MLQASANRTASRETVPEKMSRRGLPLRLNGMTANSVARALPAVPRRMTNDEECYSTTVIAIAVPGYLRLYR